MHKVSTSPEICASTTLWKLKCQIEPSTQAAFFPCCSHPCARSSFALFLCISRQDPFWLFDVRWNDGCQSPLLSHEPYGVSVACPLSFVQALQPQQRYQLCVQCAVAHCLKYSFCHPIENNLSIWYKDGENYYMFDEFWVFNCQSHLSLFKDSSECYM